MQDLHYSLQKDNQFRRLGTLLRHINHANQQITATELAQKLECSKPTLREDIAVLHSKVGDYVQVTINRQGKISYEMKHQMSVDSIIALLARETIVYKIMDSIFQNKRWTLQQAMLELVMSRTHLLRMIRHMNKVLKAYNLVIDTSIIEFIGKEEDKRIGLFTFYSDFWNDPLLTEQAQAETKELFQIAVSTNLHFSHYRLVLWLYVTQKRWSHNSFLTVPKEVLLDCLAKEDFAAFKKQIQACQTPKSIPEEEIAWLYATTLYTVSYSTNYTQKSFLYHLQTNEEAVSQVQHFLTQSGEAFSPLMESFLINTSLLSEIAPRFEKISPRLKSNILIQVDFKQVYEKWHRLLSASTFGFTFMEDVAVQLTILQSAFLKSQHLPKVKVLFAFQGEADFDEYLAETAKSKLTSNIVAKYLFGAIITPDTLKKEKPDLIVSNYDLQIAIDGPTPFIRLSNFPTAADWEEVRLFVKGVTTE